MKIANRFMTTVLALLVLPLIARANDPLVLACDGQALAAVAVSDDADSTVREAADGLARVLGAMSAAQFVLQSAARGPSIVVGARAEDAGLAPLAFHVSREGDRLLISGGSAQGVINGVYAFLEHLGCRWYVVGDLGEYIPRVTTIEVGDLELQDAPDYDSVSGFGPNDSAPAEGRKWLRRNRLIGFPNQYHGHNWANIIHPDQREAHPEWFALVAGGRSDQLCTTHPDVLDSAIAVSNLYFDMYPENPMFSLSPNDNGKFCECDRCRALDAELGVVPDLMNGPYTDRLVYFFNQVAAGVREKHPDAGLAFYAYISHTEPPRVVRPDPMLIPVICHTPWEFCQHHAIDDPQCDRNARLAGIIDGWSEMSPRVYVYDYYGHYYWYGPMGLVHAIRRDLPWLRAHGVVGFNSETHGNWWTQGLNFYVAAKLFWDLEADVDAIVRGWYTDLYGPAAPAMATYGQVWEDVVANVPYGEDIDTERAFVKDVTNEFIASTGALLDQARGLAGAMPDGERKERILLRIRKVSAGQRMAGAQAAFVRARQSGDATFAVLDSETPLDVIADIEADPIMRDVMEFPTARQFLSEEVGEFARYRRIWTDSNMPGADRALARQLVQDGRSGEAARLLGHVTRWRVAGLFDAPTLDDLLVPLAPESDARADAVYNGKNGQVAWQTVVVDNAYGAIDLRALFADQGTNRAVAYAVAEVKYSGGMVDAEVRFSSNDGGMLWYDGRLVVSSVVESGWQPDTDRVRVRLKPGRHTFMAKVINTENNFKLSLRVLDFRGKPIVFEQAE